MNTKQVQTERVSSAALVKHLVALKGGKRHLIAIAGAPGSGKSTLTQSLCTSINLVSPGLSQILAMDGFHLDDRVLEARGQGARKGAPYTFDVDGFAATLARLAADNGKDVAVPVFDRSIEIARAGADIIHASTRIVLVEGNYLLLDELDWEPLRSYFSVTVLLDVPRDMLITRLFCRWRGYGLDEATVCSKVMGNDILNVDHVLSLSSPAQFIVEIS